MARTAFVPITMGASGAASLAVDGFLVTDAGFPPGQRLPPHAHDRASLAVMLEGSFDLRIMHRDFPCPPGSTVAEPVEERHANALGTAGAHVLVIQPDPVRLDRLGPCAKLFDEVRHAPRSPVSGAAWHIVRELRSVDDLTPVVVEGLVFEILALATRQSRPDSQLRATPPWLERVRESLHDGFRASPRIGDLAAEAGVHPDSLARAFRARFGVPIGAYARRLRIDWAITQVETTQESIAQIALAAGFVDQSHFTRAFKHHTGMAPAEYRRAHRLRH